MVRGGVASVAWWHGGASYRKGTLGCDAPYRWYGYRYKVTIGTALPALPSHPHLCR